jgi:UPF0755 protein
MLFLCLLGCFLLDDRIDTPVDPSDTSVGIFEVPAGASARSIGPSLVDAGFIESADVWKLYLKTRDAGACLKAGRFELSRSMNMPQIMETLCGVPIPDDEPFTVVEGWRIREIDAALTEKGWIEPGEYAAAASDPSRFELPFTIRGLSSLEGFLFPETYRVEPEHFTAEGFIQRQLDTFNTKFLEPAGDAVDERGIYPLVIMASMIEREEPRPVNRPVVSGIIWKRLDNKWNLGIDATSRYTLEDWNDRQAFLKKLRDEDDPYNTRKRQGLPPTPIGNPGIESLNAALTPEDSLYWYYLHDAEGNLHPAENLRGHEANRRKYNVY